MNNQPARRTWRRIGIILSIVLTPIVLLTAILIGFQSTAMASSHREAPLISKDASADNTDTYVFISPENPDNIVFVGSWIPLEAPEGGPNYYEWDDSALYDIYVDNNGDAQPDITYTLSSKVKTENDLTFLYNTGTIKALTDVTWNRKQYITVTETTKNGSVTLFANKLTAPVNIGSKSTPNFQALADAAIQPITTTQGAGKIYAGQTDDPFWVDLQVFDLLTLRGQKPPIGYQDGANLPVDSLSSYNVHSLVIEVPISHVTSGSDPVIGMWSGTRRPSMRVIGALNTVTNTMPYVQVSRLGMPLVNEVVIPLALKDAFNSLRPENDLDVYTSAKFGPLLQKSVENPELGTLLCKLYGVPVPNAVDATSSDPDKKCNTKVNIGTPQSGRADIFQIFLTGIPNLNKPATVRPAEMLRINTSIKGSKCAATPSRLGVLGSDLCGFPNGRRLTDDVVEIELLAVAGAAYKNLDGKDAGFTFDQNLAKVLTDGVDYNDIPFRGAVKPGDAPKTFPYLGTAQSGQSHWHLNPFFNLLLPWVHTN